VTVNTGNASLTTAIRVLEAEADAIRSLVDRLGESFLQAVDLASACSGKIAVTGLGKSGIICKKIAATLSSTGSPDFSACLGCAAWGLRIVGTRGFGACHFEKR